MKTKTLLIAAVMFLGLTAAAFAQATYSVGSIPVTAVVNTGLVEKTGDITFTQISGAPMTGTITVSYGVQITNDTSTGIGITVISPTTGATNPPTINTVSNAAGQVVINVQPTTPGGTTNVTVFALTGVRVAVAGTTLSNLTANISATNNAITAGQTSVVVVSSIAPGIASIKTTTVGSVNATTGKLNKDSEGVDLQPVITVKEGFLNAWGTPADLTAAGLRITLSAAPPSGVTVGFPLTASTDGTGVFQAMDSKGNILTSAQSITSSSTALALYYKVVTGTDPTKQETLTINPTITVSSSVTLPLPAISITYVVSMAPIGTAFDSDGKVITDTKLIPRYVALDVGPATLLNVVGNTTTMLIPFAQTVTAAGYNTGFAIANTTEDPGTPTGFESPVAQSGVITFYFFPQVSATGTSPTNFSYTTAASSPGTGLDATGKLPSGSTYTVLLSQLLSAAAAPADFSGYIFVVANFTNAHCLYVVSNFTTFSQGSLALIITQDRTNAPESLNN